MLKHATILAAALGALTTFARAEDATPPAASIDTAAPATDTAAPAADVKADTVVATVNGQDITLGQMIITRAQLPQQYQSLPDDVLFKGILDQLVQQQLLAETLTDVPSRVTYAMQNEERSLKAGEVITQLTATAVTDEAIQKLYDSQIAGAAPETEYHAAHILVPTEEEAKAAKARIDGGEDFAAVARDVSKDSSAQNGGDLGWFSKGMMVPDFEKAVTEMQPGQVSDPVQTQFGWHIIKLDETRLKQAPALADVRDQLVSQLQQEAVQAKIKALTDAASITRTEDGAIDPSVLKNLDLLK